MAEYSQNWDLESIFPGGSSSEELREQLYKVEKGIGALGDYVKTLEPQLQGDQLAALLNKMQAVLANLGEPAAFIGCLTAQDVGDEKARLLQGGLGGIRARLAAVLTKIEGLLLAIPEEDWAALLADPSLLELSFPLQELRLVARTKMKPDQEALAADLAVDGYHAWSQFYNLVVGRMTVEVERDGKVQRLSVGQAANLFGEAQRDLRRAVFEKLAEAWAQEGELCAAALNHLAGFRLNLYKNRAWEDVLEEPLRLNRMQRGTLEAMWAAVEEGKPFLKRYLQRKAWLLGLERLSWFDLGAPLGKVSKRTFPEAAQFIVEQLRRFSPEIADFTEGAFAKNWIEAEDRGGKRPGAFCTTFPLSKESRVFLTYGGTIKSLGTLAHELGHAYHAYVLKEAPLLLRRYAMNVAETASTFGELLVVDGALGEASAPGEKLGILEDKVQRGVAFFMDIQARFLFETRFYQARSRGLLGVGELNELMLQAQKDAFLESLADYHPYFWASKLHFYLSGVPFYNFPYTFGYLFSAGVYARAKEEGPSFAQDYKRLLQDTAKMTVEDLARKHLGADLTQPEFWEAAVQLTKEDVQDFLQLTANLGKGSVSQ